MKNNTITLAYSGGLDTSYCIPYLIDKGYEVHAIHINTGAFSDKDVSLLNARALEMGASLFKSIDIEQEYYDKCLKYLIYGNILRNNNYPLSVSSERPFQSLALVQYCKENNIGSVAHGCTGAGNDPIRFDLIFKILAPEIEIVSPIRDLGLSREEEIKYLHSKGLYQSTRMPPQI